MDTSALEHLTRAAAAGDREALEGLLEHHLPALRVFVRMRTDAALRKRESSSDLVQSICREVLQRADRFRHPDEEGFRRWLFTMALRKIHDRRDYHLAERRDAHREVAGRTSSADELLLQTYSEFVTPSRAAAAREELERVERALDALPDEYREVISLSRVVGLSHARIAEEMGRSEGAVRMLLHRALARLVTELEYPRGRRPG